MKKFTLPASKYFVGDPCFVIDDSSRWMRFLESCCYFEDSVRATDDGDEFWASPTKIGNGTFASNTDDLFVVDSGLIGVVPSSLLEKCKRNEAELNKLGKIVEFKEPFVVIFNPYDSAGLTHIIGNIKIFTDEESEAEKAL
jgi:hypothetical protein